MRGATTRMLAMAGSLAVVVLFGSGCPTANSDPNNNKPVATVEVSPAIVSLIVGATRQLTAITRIADGTEVTGRFCTWFSSNDHFVTISENGLITAVAVGNVTIRAICETIAGTAEVAVSAVPVASVSVTGVSSVKQYHYTQLTAVAKDAAGNVLDRAISWISASEITASVTQTGQVFGGSEGGPVRITATSEGKSGFLDVTVLHDPVATLTISPASKSLVIGETAILTPELKDIDGNILFNRNVTWISAVPGIVSVSGQADIYRSGLLTAIAQGGPLQVTATSENVPGFAYVTVIPPPNPGILTGRVINFTTGAGVGGAAIQFQSGSNTLGTTTSAADGSFTSPGLPSPAGGIWILASATGYARGEILVAAVPMGTTTYTEPIPLVPQSAAHGSISGVVRNARTGQGVPSASVTLNSYSNPTNISLTTDAQGFFKYNDLAAGTYRLSGFAPGYQVAQRTGVSVGNNTETSGQDLVLSPAGSNDVRIVLTWGSTPSDLDSHLTGPNADASRFHVYYSNRGSTTSAPFAALDLDDVTSFGPETITITQMNSGNYRYSVHDYSDRVSNTSTLLGSSGAKVEVYTSAGLAQTFFVPNQAGTLWTVFEMTGPITNPVITPRNEMSFTQDPSGILSPPISGVPSANDAALIARAILLTPKPLPH